MAIPFPDWNDLRDILLITDAGSLSGAARIAGISQSTMSRRLSAIEAAGRQGEGIVITGIDANPQARDAIAAGGNFEASMAQDFAGIGAATFAVTADAVAGKQVLAKIIYVPTVLITAANAAQ